MLRAKRVEWRVASNEEIKSIEDNNVFEIVDRPSNVNILDTRWIFKIKIGKNGKILYKVRLVTGGYLDEKQYELKETYAPISGLPVVRTALSIINKHDLEARQSGVKTAFLNSKLLHPIYVEIPEGYDCSEEDRKTKVWKLNRALYGLKISPKRWYKRFYEEALKLGLEHDNNEPCLFTWRKEGRVAIVVLYVDDMITACNDPEKLKEITTH